VRVVGGKVKSIRIAVFVLAAAAALAQLSAVYAAVSEHSRSESRVVRMSLEEIETAAMQGNPEIKAASRRVAIAEARVPGAGALDDPMVMYRNWGTPLNQPLNWNQAQNMFMVQQMFPGPGKRALRSQVAGSETAVPKLQLETVRRDIAVKVKKAFYDLLRNNDELRIHDEQSQVARQALESARIKYTVGRVPQQDVLKAQIAMTKLEEHRIGVEQEGDMARATLNSLMGRDPAAPLEVAGQYTPIAEIPSLLDLERIALENRPELRANKAEQNVLAQKEQLAKKAYTPDFTLAAGYMLMPQDVELRHTYAAEVTINLPWLNKRKHDSEIAEARTMTEVTRAEYDAQRAAIFLEIQEALIRARSARRSVELYRDTLKPQAESTFKAAAAAYQHDRTDFLNLVDSQNMMLDVQSSFYRSAAELDSRLAELERAIGTTLPDRMGQMRSERRQ
jgi:outer membrane protein, heavy metal efflux system